MAKIVRRDYGQGSDTEEQKLDNDELSLDRMIYRTIGSLTDNKTITSPLSKYGDFERWLLDMNNLHDTKYYPDSHIGPIPTPDLLALDEYLGSLGDTEEYPFLQDTYDVLPWLTVQSQTEYRILSEMDDDGLDIYHLTDNNDTEVLVYYT